MGCVGQLGQEDEEGEWRGLSHRLDPTRNMESIEYIMMNLSFDVINLYARNPFGHAECLL